MRTVLALAVCLLLTAGGCSRDEPASGAVEAPQRPDRFLRDTEITEQELSALRRAVEEHPEDAAAHQQFARGLRDVKKRDEALVHFERANQLEPNNPRYLLDLALAYASVARLQEAEAIYQQLEKVPSTRALALHNMGNLALRRENFERAIELYQQAIEAKPDYMLAYYHLGVVLEQSEQYRDAYRAFGKVLEFPPPEGDPAVLGGYVDALYRMGKLDLMMGATERGTELLGELLQAYPEHPNAHYQYGRALLLLGRKEEAEREFDLHMQILARKKPQGPVETGD